MRRNGESSYGRETMTQFLALTVADDPEVWSGLGFTVANASLRIGATEIVCSATTLTDPSARGITGWIFSSIDGSFPDLIDGLPTKTVRHSGTPPTMPSMSSMPLSALSAPTHPNGVVGIDHLVVSTPDVDRTIAALEHLGMECRRRRLAAAYGNTPMRQAFFWLGNPPGTPDGRIILEVVGPVTVDPAKANDPARFFGLALTCTDLDSTVAFFGELVKPPVAAVQAGRRIATLSSRAGSSVAIAFMSPHP